MREKLGAKTEAIALVYRYSLYKEAAISERASLILPLRSIRGCPFFFIRRGILLLIGSRLSTLIRRILNGHPLGSDGTRSQERGLNARMHVRRSRGHGDCRRRVEYF